MPAILILALLSLRISGETRTEDAARIESPGPPAKSERETSSAPSPGILAPGARSHIRAFTPGAAELLRAASAESSIFRDLLDRLEATDLVVYLTEMTTWSRSAPQAQLAFVTTAEKTRYVLIRIDGLRLSHVDRISALGHELQHALEVAADPTVRDSAGLAALYRRIGWEAQRGRFETSAAREVGTRVRRELIKGVH